MKNTMNNSSRRRKRLIVRFLVFMYMIWIPPVDFIDKKKHMKRLALFGLFAYSELDEASKTADRLITYTGLHRRQNVYGWYKKWSWRFRFEMRRFRLWRVMFP